MEDEDEDANEEDLSRIEQVPLNEDLDMTEIQLTQ